MIRHSDNASESWRTLPWKQFRRNLFRLQRRVFKAVQAGDKRKAMSLQKLILKSKMARLLAIRQVTQLNAGKKTAGIDGKASLTIEERLTLEELLKKSYLNWHHSKLRQIPIPKKDGFTRILKVPTIADRAWQCLVKYALEPAHEATFHARSYGFRPGRSTHDAQKKLFHNLRSQSDGINKRVIELDIEKCVRRDSPHGIPNLSWEKLRRTFLGQPTNLESKDKGESSMLVKRGIEIRRSNYCPARPVRQG